MRNTRLGRERLTSTEPAAVPIANQWSANQRVVSPPVGVSCISDYSRPFGILCTTLERQ